MALGTRAQAKIEQAIRDREVFKIASMSGRRFVPLTLSSWDTGRLGEKWVAELLSVNAEHAVYVVYSYQTPIAWYANGQWTHTDERHSNTTMNHRNAIQAAS